MDIIYHVRNENVDQVEVTLDFTGSAGIALLEPILPSGNMRVRTIIPGNEKIKIARVQQITNAACTLRMGCSVSQASSGQNKPSITGTTNSTQQQPQSRARRASVSVGDEEKKQLAPGIFLFKQKMSSPLGYQYSFENQKKSDYEFSMDLSESVNVQLVGTTEMKVTVVAAPTERVHVATAVQRDSQASILVKTKIGVKELRTVSKVRTAPIEAPIELKGPEGSGLMVCVKDFRASNRSEMDISIGDEIFLQGGNSGKGDNFAVGINARSGASGLCPLDCLETAENSAVQVAGKTGFNNVHKKNENGAGWGKVEVPMTKVSGADAAGNGVGKPVSSKKRVSVLELANANSNTCPFICWYLSQKDRQLHQQHRR